MVRKPIRQLIWFAMIVRVGPPCSAWDTPPHQQITKAALDTLPKRFARRLGSETKPLIEIYCILPDRYEEMGRFGFVLIERIIANLSGNRSGEAARYAGVRSYFVAG